METDFSLYYTIRLEDKKGKQFGDAAFESQKCSFSSNHVGVCVRALLNHNILKEAFDPLLEVPGLRPGMRFTTLHKLCCAKSDEEAAAYLQHTFDLWLDIALGSPENIKKINTKDVQAIELRCPRLCSRDAVDINGMFNNGSIFTAFDENDRQAIRQKILSIDYIIPSLHTFFQDVHLLELCATSMRSIVPPNNRMTIRATLRENYKPLRFGQSTRNRDSSTNEVSSNETDSFNSAMELLWIFVMGQFQRVPPKKRGKRLLADYPRKHSKEKREKLLSRFAKLAQSLGFEIRKIKGLSKLKIADYSENSIEHNIDSQLQSTLLQTRDSAVSIIKRDLKKTYDRSVARPELYARILRQRCGRPKHKRYRRDRNRLTKDLIHFDYGALDVKGQDITSFLVLRSQCLLFFSNPKEDLGHIYLSPLLQLAIWNNLAHRSLKIWKIYQNKTIG
ncbi:LOW QUALITY PROTEIN: hypothetical protein N5P37_005640 [Trichoderma harzianum]|nr:LOW QUALITY PROTEIN: hypothetical protein N5P37_005640 [Trichoderma harzianum]